MKTNDPAAGKIEKYEKWFPLFEKEIRLVAKSDARIISIGNQVNKFLTEKALIGHIGSITHYAATASKYRGKEIPGRQDEFRAFSKTLKKFPCGKVVSDSQKKLLFDYKIRFNRIRNQRESGWRYWQQEWQRRLTLT